MPAERHNNMRAVAALLAAAAVIVAGCGTSDDIATSDESGRTAATATAASAASTTMPLPATTLLTPPGSTQVPIGSIVPVAVTEPCPTSSPRSNDGTDDGSAMMTESGRLEPMLGHVLGYGAQHPDEFGSYGLVWHASDDASVFVSFTGRLDLHRTELEATVEYPDELIVCQVSVAGEVARQLEAQLVGELQGRFLSIGRGGAGVRVTLPADQVALAGELRERYGDAVELTIGALAYPIEDATSVCPEPPTGRQLPGLSVEIVAPSGPISAPGMQTADLVVTLSNTGESPIRFESGAATGTILDAEGQVVNADVMGTAGVGIPVDLAPGATTELPLSVSTVSCDPALGYALPPGDYALIAAIFHFDGESTTLLSSPIPITVEP